MRTMNKVVPQSLLLQYLLVLLVATVTVTTADKDGSYYPSGMRNPNVNEKMYWRNAKDVIDDISSFDALYVKFHSCAWSPYAEGCGAEGDDTTWYWGFTSCFRANAGFSLYGALKNKRDKGCSKAAYINSFFTNTGVEAFTEAMEEAGFSFSAGDDDSTDDEYAGGVSSICTSEQNDDDGNRNRNHMEKSHKKAKSYGIACNGNQFVKRSFYGSYCDGNSIMRSTTDKLKTFNTEMNNVECVRIYDSLDGYDEDGAVGLLYNSQACSIRAYPGACPDPHGKLERYTSSLERATGASTGWGIGGALKGFFSWVMLLAGLTLFALGMYAIRWREHRRRKAHERRKQARATGGSTGGGVPRIGKMFRTRGSKHSQRSERSDRGERERSHDRDRSDERYERESDYESP